MMHNLTPGPQLFLTKADTINTLFAGFMVANCFMLLLGLLGQPLFVKIVSIPKRILVPTIIDVYKRQDEASGTDPSQVRSVRQNRKRRG